MTSYLLIFAAALILSIGTTPIAERVALRLGILDRPSQRKIHLQPIPLLGGAAIYLAFTLALLFGQRYNLPQMIGILLGATLVSFLGIWDDSLSLRPLLKLLGQVLAALILILSGVQVLLFPSPPLNYALTILWVVGITNALNLLDNMDGLSGGIAAVAAGFFFLMAAMSGQYLVASLAIALLGACLGFLRYNFNPARIFMGDTGSLFLGFVLAAVGIKLRFDNTILVTWMIPVLVLGLPIFDTTLVTLSRLRRGLNPLTTSGRDHTSHRLVALGMSHRQAVLVLYAVSGLLGLSGLALMEASPVQAYMLAGAVAALGLIALVKLERMCYPKAVSSSGLENVEAGS